MHALIFCRLDWKFAFSDYLCFGYIWASSLLLNIIIIYPSHDFNFVIRLFKMFIFYESSKRSLSLQST